MKAPAAHFVIAAHSPADFPTDGRPEVAFVGRSNVGKSSLMNRLLASRGLARVSSTPGRTRSINYFEVDGGYYFVDLPGYGFAKVGKSLRRQWAELVDRYLRRQGCRRLIVQLVDAKVGATALDEEAHRHFRGLGVEPLVVATKIDRLPRGRWQAAVAAVRRTLDLPTDRPLAFSARTGEGLRTLWREIRSFLDPPHPRSPPSEASHG